MKFFFMFFILLVQGLKVLIWKILYVSWPYQKHFARSIHFWIDRMSSTVHVATRWTSRNVNVSSFWNGIKFSFRRNAMC